jgi:cell division septal protein FtsQ
MSQMARTRPRVGLPGETEFLRKRNNRIINKEKRKRAIRIRGLHIFLIFLCLTAAAFLAYKIGISVLTWEKLNVKSFVLVNKPKYKTAELETVLRRFNGNILSLSFGRLREKLLTFSEVKDVSLSRQLPSTVEIRFLLRKPVFQFAINGKYNIIDEEGVVLYTSEKSRDDLISIRSITTGELGSITQYLPELSRIRKSLEYVTLKKPYGITLKLKGTKEVFYPGETDFAGKLQYYLKLKRKPPLNKYNITCVDLRFKDRFYFEYDTEVIN